MGNVNSSLNEFQVFFSTARAILCVHTEESIVKSSQRHIVGTFFPNIGLWWIIYIAIWNNKKSVAMSCVVTCLIRHLLLFYYYSWVIFSISLISSLSLIVYPYWAQHLTQWQTPYTTNPIFSRMFHFFRYNATPTELPNEHSETSRRNCVGFWIEVRIDLPLWRSDEYQNSDRTHYSVWKWLAKILCKKKMWNEGPNEHGRSTKLHHCWAATDKYPLWSAAKGGSQCLKAGWRVKQKKDNHNAIIRK